MPVPVAPPPVPPAPHPLGGSAARQRLRRVFLEGFRAMDVAEPLASFDGERSAAEVRAFMDAHALARVGVRRDGRVRGYAERADLEGGGRCEAHLRPFGPDDVVSEDASLLDVIQSLGVNGRCFVTVLDEAAAVVTLRDLEKPPVRMFLFGMISILEMVFVRVVEQDFPAEAWRAHVSPGRLAKAEEIQAERRRRGIESRLLDCLQFADKGELILHAPGFDAERLLGMSQKATKRALKELQEIRNNLAHGQEVIATGWPRIVIFSSRLDHLLEAL